MSIETHKEQTDSVSKNIKTSAELVSVGKPSTHKTQNNTSLWEGIV